ncbi:fimbrial protein [Enterobacter soli]|uniref:fimbrial protein n=1 Tax=Enterobacter soli TaxID=885040 RepID=UPI0034CDB22B
MKKLIVTLLGCGWALSAFAAHDGTVNMDGKIEDNTCTVAQASADQSVTLGEIGSKDLRQAGDTSQPVAFSIDLQNCGAATTGVELTFTGSADATNPALLALSQDAGAASGLGVAIKDDKSTLIALNSPSRVYALDPSQTDNRLTFYAQYSATSSTVTAGAANATATFTLTWQ